jgi:hypothetical protein
LPSQTPAPTAAKLLLGLPLTLAATSASAEPITVKFPESTAHGFVVLRNGGGNVLAHGELEQTTPTASRAASSCDSSIGRSTTRP